jgi:CBS domain containing-hemolysin-like protein
VTSVLALAATFVLIALNGLFVAVEFSLIAARRTRIEASAGNGERGARAALASMRELPLTLSGAQLGITVTSLGLGLVAEPALAHLLEAMVEGVAEVPSGVLHGFSFGVALFVVVMLHMVFGEMVPKNLALAEAERTVRVVAPMYRVFLTAFRPIIWVLNRCAALLLRPFGIDQVDELGTAHTAQEFVTMIDASKTEGLIDEFRHGLLSGVLDFRGRCVADVMVPWEGVDVVGRGATVAQASAIAATSGHTRLPVVADTTVLGFVHAKDLLSVDDDELDHPMRLGLIRRMLVVPADRSLEDLLFSMRRNRIHVAVVREGEQTVGIVSLEDVLESIVGDIIDESDRIRRVERVH